VQSCKGMQRHAKNKNKQDQGIKNWSLSARYLKQVITDPSQTQALAMTTLERDNPLQR